MSPIMREKSTDISTDMLYTKLYMIPRVKRDLDDVSPIDTSCEAIKHQSTIVRFGDSLDKKGIGITSDPFGAGAYNL